MMNKDVKGILALVVVTALSFGVIFGTGKLTKNSGESAAENTGTVQAELDVSGAENIERAVQMDDGSYVVSVKAAGYGGDIQVTVGITADGTVSGVSFLSISETAGLGMKATEPSFYEQYVGVQAEQFYVSKDGGQGEPIDALSGATITTRAVTGAVNAALGYFQNAF